MVTPELHVRRLLLHYQSDHPPSTARIAPVTSLDALDAIMTNAPFRRGKGPGLMALTRVSSGACLTAE